jgi:Uma2 family endonuclease
MATLIETEITPANAPHVRRWTRDEYYKMNDMGLFAGKRVELIEGEIIEMSAIYGPHATGVTLADDVMRKVFGEGWVVRVQNPLSFSGISEPEPDIAVVAGRTRDFNTTHPKTAALVIEVADSSLKYDRDHKGSLYAKVGIADYWIVNVQERQLEVHRQPVADGEAEFGLSYADVQILQAGDSVSPLAKPEAVVAVADLLP